MYALWLSSTCFIYLGLYVKCTCDGGPVSVLGIATSYVLDGPWIESLWGARFSAPVRTGRGTHPAFCTVGTGSFPEVKSGRSVTLTLHPLLCRGQEKVELYYFPYGPHGLYRASVTVQWRTLPYFLPGSDVSNISSQKLDKFLMSVFCPK